MKQTLLVMVMVCLSAVVAAQDTLGNMRGNGAGYAQVLPGQSLIFPRDHAAHPDFRIEWWYLTANLTDARGRLWGVQWTLFRQALSPESSPAGWQSNQMWMAHAAITTPEGHFHAQRFARGGIGQAGVNQIEQDGYFNAWVDDWAWRSSGADCRQRRITRNNAPVASASSRTGPSQATRLNPVAVGAIRTWSPFSST